MSAENAEQAPNFELPKLAPEQAPTEERRQEGIERGGASREAAPKAPAAAQPQMPAPAIPATQPPATTPPASAAHSTSTDDNTSGLAAKDADLIEKEWVDKSKKIVSATREDPYKQKNEMSRVKADYVQKRFNKTLKVDDAPA